MHEYEWLRARKNKTKKRRRESERVSVRERDVTFTPILKGKYQLVILGAMPDMKHSEFQLVSTFLNCILSPIKNLKKNKKKKEEEQITKQKHTNNQDVRNKN